MDCDPKMCHKGSKNRLQRIIPDMNLAAVLLLKIIHLYRYSLFEICSFFKVWVVRFLPNSNLGRDQKMCELPVHCVYWFVSNMQNSLTFSLTYLNEMLLPWNQSLLMSCNFLGWIPGMVNLTQLLLDNVKICIVK